MEEPFCGETGFLAIIQKKNVDKRPEMFHKTDTMTFILSNSQCRKKTF